MNIVEGVHCINFGGLYIVAKILQFYFSKILLNISGAYRFLKRLAEFLKNLAESSLIVASFIELTFPSTRGEEADLGLLQHQRWSSLQ